MEISTNAIIAAIGGLFATGGLGWAVVKQLPALKLPSFANKEVPPEKQFLADLGLVLDLQARLVESGNVAAAKLCDQIKLEMLKAPVPQPKEPEKRPL